jgi:hydrogenase maturation protease
MSPKYDVVVIGYGNELRGDDGIGPQLAAEIDGRNWPGVRVVAVAQLMPELATILADARRAIFIDACLPAAGEPVRVRRLEAGASGSALTHTGSPERLLGLALALYGNAPEAWLVTVMGCDFGLREQLSPEAQRHTRDALARIEALARAQEIC